MCIRDRYSTTAPLGVIGSGTGSVNCGAGASIGLWYRGAFTCPHAVPVSIGAHASRSAVARSPRKTIRPAASPNLVRNASIEFKLIDLKRSLSLPLAKNNTHHTNRSSAPILSVPPRRALIRRLAKGPDAGRPYLHPRNRETGTPVCLLPLAHRTDVILVLIRTGFYWANQPHVAANWCLSRSTSR